jgi:hypothetical protein
VQINGFFETTERLPEIALDVKRQPLFDSGIFYESETTFANLRRDFPRGSENVDYSALRFDTFHQFVYPQTYFGWLSVVPRLGFRSTYYSESRDLSGTLDVFSDDALVPGFLIPPPTLRQPLVRGGDRLRNIFNTGRGELVQDFTRVGRRAEPCARPRRITPYHPAVRESLLRGRR